MWVTYDRDVIFDDTVFEGEGDSRGGEESEEDCGELHGEVCWRCLGFVEGWYGLLEELMSELS
jgi:hypothetical protein